MSSGDEVAVLELVQEWLADENHWVRGGLVTYSWGGGKREVARTCLVGAVHYAINGRVNGLDRHPPIFSQVLDQLEKVIWEQFPDRAEYWMCVPEFNDDRATTFADVQLVVDKALAQAREEAGL